MMLRNVQPLAFAMAAMLCVGSPSAGDTPSHDAFTYQGQLNHNSEPVNAPVNFAFRLYDAAMGGNHVGPEIEAFAFDAFDDDGRFTIDLAFGKGVFDGTQLWLEVRVNGGPLTPRQPIMPTPYAIRALNINHVPDGALAGTYTNTLTLNNPGNQFIGAFAGGGAGLTNLNASNIATGTLGGSLLGGSYTNAVNFSSAGNTFSGSGAGLLNLNASNISSGVLNDARLSANVARRDLQNTFAQDNYFPGKVAIGQYPPSHRQFQAVSSGLTATAYFGNESETGGIALEALAIGLTNSVAIRGESHGATGTGVWAWASSYTGQPKALFAWCDAPNGYAGYFLGGRNYFSGRVGVGTDDPNAAMHAVTNSGQQALFGNHTAASGVTYGVRGQTASNNGYGVFGHASASTGNTRGVVGQSNSTSGVGVMGLAEASTGAAIGVFGNSESGSGTGVSGSGKYGVRGTSSWVGGTGVYGQGRYGVQGFSSTSNGTAVHAQVTSQASDAHAVYGFAGGDAWAAYLVGRAFISGNVGLGTVPGFRLHLATNSAAKPTSNTWTISSDARLKKNINTIDHALDQLLRLRGVTYQWINPDSQGGMDGAYTGFIAQEVETVFPDWIGEDETGYKHLTVIGFEGLVVEALRELVIRGEEKDARIAALATEAIKQQAQIQTLQAANDELRSRLAAVEHALTSGR